MIYETEKALKELEGKISDEEKKTVEDAKEDLRKALEANNPDDIKAKTEALTEKFHTISTKLYQQAQAQQGAGPDMGAGMGAGTGAGPDMNAGNAGNTGNAGPAGDNVVDADYEVVDDDK